jgi:hypothetical protein
VESGQLRRRELHAHLVDLLDADAVLAGDRAAERHRQLEDFGAESFGALPFAGVGWRRTGSADAGCRRRHGRRWRSAGRTSSTSSAMAVSISASRLRGMVPSMQ